MGVLPASGPAVEGFTPHPLLPQHPEFYRRVLEEFPAPVSVLDAVGQVIYTNRAGRRESGWSIEEVIGSNVLNRIHPDEQAWAMEVYAGATEAAPMGEDEPAWGTVLMHVYDAARHPHPDRGDGRQRPRGPVRPGAHLRAATGLVAGAPRTDGHRSRPGRPRRGPVGPRGLVGEPPALGHRGRARRPQRPERAGARRRQRRAVAGVDPGRRSHALGPAPGRGRPGRGRRPPGPDRRDPRRRRVRRALVPGRRAHRRGLGDFRWWR